jgi:hypothetical protein
MTSPQIFAAGLSVFKAHEQAPEFVKCELSIDPKIFMQFIGENREHITDKGYFRLTIKESREGKLYAVVNTYKSASGA